MQTPKCFVIMPISTPEIAVAAYGGDVEHFAHVLEYLFVPAIAKAGFEAVKPIAQGADVIQAEIIKNLEAADLVLCDISTLNPNVFFELGCRTALNKPVCYVMDDLTGRIPFDTGIINHQTYLSKLTPWTINDQIDRLGEHIRTSAERSAGRNMLWQYFGLRSTAHAAATGTAEADKLEYLLMQVDAIKKTVEEQRRPEQSLPISYSVGTSTFDWESLPANMTFTSTPPWQTYLSDAEHDLKEILRFQKHPQANVKQIRTLVDQHIKNLSELVDAAPLGIDLEKARSLLSRFRSMA